MTENARLETRGSCENHPTWHASDQGPHRVASENLRDRCNGVMRRSSVRRWYNAWVELLVEIDQEDDGRWIAEIPSLPGVMAYGETRSDALRAVEALALRVLADRIEDGEIATPPVSLSFVAA